MASPWAELHSHEFYQNSAAPKMFTFAHNLSKTARRTPMKAAACYVLRMSSIYHFQLWNVALCGGGEKQGTHAETDILRALSYLWRSDQGSL
jgi:hypothetical protein